MRIITYKWINTLAYVAMVAINILANLLPLGIGNTQYISGLYPSLFTPSAYAFAIWIVIYILMGAFIVYQWGIIDADRVTNKVIVKIGPFFVISCLCNIAWIFTWHYNIIGASVLFMMGLLLSLITVKSRLNEIKSKGLILQGIDMGFSVYLGWIIAATIANISVFLVSIGWDGFGISEVTWTGVVLIAGAIIGALPQIIDNNTFATVEVIWAYVGIMVKHVSTQGYYGEYPPIVICTTLGITFMIIAIVHGVITSSVEYDSGYNYTNMGTDNRQTWKRV